MPLSLPLHNFNGIGNALRETPQSNTRRQAQGLVVRMASSDASISSFEEGKLVRPKWAGHTPLSRLVAALISFKPFYSILKHGARQVFIRSISFPFIPFTTCLMFCHNDVFTTFFEFQALYLPMEMFKFRKNGK